MAQQKAALSVAYGAGLRVSEVANLKVSDIDRERTTLRVEQGRGQRDRTVMLSPRLLQLLREWWKAARPQVWMFPGQNLINPTPRQLNRAVTAAKTLAGITKRVSPHTLRHFPGLDPIGANIAGRCFGRCVFVVAARVDVGASPQSSLAGERG
jgi:integrase